jgi:type VI secretion system protein ImpA
MRVPLLAWPDFSPPFINLGDWQRALTTEFGAGAAAAAGNAKSKSKDVAEEPSAQTVSRQDILDHAMRDLHALAALDDRVALAVDAWRDLTALLDERLGADAPSLSKVTEMLLRMRQALRSLLQERDPRDEEEPATSWAADAPTPLTASMDENDMSEAPSPPPPPAPTLSSAPLPQAAASGRIGSRAEAYQLLELAAAYLMREEPHSPTPYLVNRAVAWGRMPLPQLMQEVLREDGDLNRYFSIIGVRPDA